MNKVMATNYININNYSMLNLRIYRGCRTLKVGHDLRLGVVDVITSPECRRLSSSSSEMFRTPRLAPTGRKFDQKLSWEWSRRPTRFNSTKQFCWVESRRAMWSRLKGSSWWRSWWRKGRRFLLEPCEQPCSNYRHATVRHESDGVDHAWVINIYIYIYIYILEPYTGHTARF